MSVLFLEVHTESVTMCSYAYVTGLLEKHSHVYPLLFSFFQLVSQHGTT